VLWVWSSRAAATFKGWPMDELPVAAWAALTGAAGVVVGIAVAGDLQWPGLLDTSIVNQPARFCTREETSGGRSPASKDRSAVRAARVPPSDRAQEPGSTCRERWFATDHDPKILDLPPAAWINEPKEDTAA